jgi:hypothetical protein
MTNQQLGAAVADLREMLNEVYNEQAVMREELTALKRQKSAKYLPSGAKSNTCRRLYAHGCNRPGTRTNA